ncbi:MAG: 3-isopropylmalate dehydrogenase [Clostridia bacterium]|nr:3-isopropylmalate dehydrogenase [Deltaproteobacteria bacterium]
MKANIVLLPGDGIGPEVVSEAKGVLDAIAQKYGHEFAYSEQHIGGIAIDKTGSALPEETLAAMKTSQAVLLGAVGGPKWDDPNAKVRPEQGLLAMRKALGLFANLRPVRVHPKLADASPLKAERLAGVDLLVVRELTGGLYFGEKKLEKTPEGERAIDTLVYHDFEVRRVVKLAFELAAKRRKKVTSVDKANVLESSRLWRRIAISVSADYKDIPLTHHLVDSCAMRLITNAAEFDVIVTENMFGDILTDEASVLSGSLGLLPSASLGEGSLGIYEPIHGSAPDIAGKGIANPLGTISSAAMLLRYSLGLEKEARAIEDAVDKVINDGVLTRDLGGSASTKDVGNAVRAAL